MIAAMEERQSMIAAFAAAVAARTGQPGGLALTGWGAPDWEALFAGAEPVALANGELLIERAAAGDDLFFLVSGQLDVAMPNRDAHVLSPPTPVAPGSLVGEIAFLDGGPRSASVWAHGPCRLFRLSRAGFEAFRTGHPVLAADLLGAIARVLAGRLRRAQGQAPEAEAGRRAGLAGLF